MKYNISFQKENSIVKLKRKFYENYTEYTDRVSIIRTNWDGYLVGLMIIRIMDIRTRVQRFYIMHVGRIKKNYM